MPPSVAIPTTHIRRESSILEDLLIPYEPASNGSTLQSLWFAQTTQYLHQMRAGIEVESTHSRQVLSRPDGGRTPRLRPLIECISIAVENWASFAGWLPLLLLFLWISDAVSRVACL